MKILCVPLCPLWLNVFQFDPRFDPLKNRVIR